MELGGRLTGTMSGRAVRLVPFVAVNALAFALSLLPSEAAGRDTGLLVAAAVLVVVVGGLVAWAPWDRMPAWARFLPVPVYVGAVFLLRESGGGLASGYGPLLLLPVLWEALYGRRAELVGAITCATATLALPIVLIGGDKYPITEWRRSALFLAVAILVGFVTQRLVQSNRRREQTLARLGEVTRALGRTDLDVRPAVCDAVLVLTGADLVALTEPSGDRLVVSGSAGMALPWTELPLDAAPGLMAEALRSGRPVFVADSTRDPRSDTLVQEARDLRSAQHEPVIREGRVAGLLSVLWRSPQRTLPAEVATTVQVFAAEAAVAIERADLIARLAALARHDPLTGLFNRRAWDEHFTREIERSKRTGRPLSVVMMDLDHFKRYNDQHGHLTGDLLLKEAAAAWSSTLRPNDVLARWGGEEFVLLMTDTGAADAATAFERLQSVTPRCQAVSAGIATFEPGDAVPDLVAAADAALDQAKADGRARAVVAQVSVGAGAGGAGGEAGPGSTIS